MHIPTSFNSLRRAALSLCAALVFAGFAVPARADHPPAVKDPEVTTFLQKSSDLIDQLLVAVKAKDDAKVKDLNAKMMTLQADSSRLKKKVTPEEDKAIENWFTEQVKALMAVGWTAPES